MPFIPVTQIFSVPCRPSSAIPPVTDHYCLRPNQSTHRLYRTCHVVHSMSTLFGPPRNHQPCYLQEICISGDSTMAPCKFLTITWKCAHYTNEEFHTTSCDGCCIPDPKNYIRKTDNVENCPDCIRKAAGPIHRFL